MRPRITETTALGAAYLAGLAVGYWDSVEQLSTQWKAERIFEPSTTADERGSRLEHWKQAVERSRGWSST